MADTSDNSIQMEAASPNLKSREDIEHFERGFSDFGLNQIFTGKG